MFAIRCLSIFLHSMEAFVSKLTFFFLFRQVVLNHDALSHFPALLNHHKEKVKKVRKLKYKLYTGCMACVRRKRWTIVAQKYTNRTKTCGDLDYDNLHIVLKLTIDFFKILVLSLLGINCKYINSIFADINWGTILDILLVWTCD